jgi:mono/diheme cytochrome c family protein
LSPILLLIAEKYYYIVKVSNNNSCPNESPSNLLLFNPNSINMKKDRIVFGLFVIIGIISVQYGCGGNNSSTQTNKQLAETEKEEASHDEMIARGRYLVTASVCNDCHSPKIMTKNGPVVDSARMLSGHSSASLMMPIDKKALTPGNWMLMAPDITAFVGPWGISYAANLTPDSATGLGTWTEDVFVNTIRKGKHLGQDGGRQLLPPMPWDYFAHYSDQDLKSIFAYLQSLPAVVNKVPAPVAPPDVAKMK